MQTDINPALAAALTLEQAAQAGEFQPTTPDGTPTVAAQLMQRAAPSLPQIAQQAGMGAQIQAAQMQQAQQALMEQAMQQQQPQGIESLNPNIQEFAEGGIVGYQAGGLTTGFAPLYQEARAYGIDLSPYDSEEERARKIARLERAKAAEREVAAMGNVPIPGQAPDVRELAANMNRRPEPQPIQVQASDPVNMLRVLQNANVPNEEKAAVMALLSNQINAAQQGGQAGGQPQEQPSALARANIQMPSRQVNLPPMPGPSSEMFESARARVEGMKPPTTTAQGIEAALEMGRARDELRRRMNIPTEMENIARQEEGFNRLFGERERLIAKRMEEVQRERERDLLPQYLMNFRQMKGRSVGEGLMTASQAAQRLEAGAKSQMQRLEDLKIDVQTLSLEKQNALAKMRDDIANGRMKDAMAERDKAIQFDNEINKTLAEIDLTEGKARSQERSSIIGAQGQRPTDTQWAMETYLNLLKTDPKAAQEFMATLENIRGAGGAGSRDIRMQQLANDELQKFMSSAAYFMIKEPNRAGAVEQKKRELMQQYPGATFTFGQAAPAAPQGAQQRPKFLGFEQPAR